MRDKNTHQCLKQLSLDADELAIALEDWLDDDQELRQPPPAPNMDKDEFDTFALSVTSMLDDAASVIDGLIEQKRDSSELQEVIVWKADIDEDIDDMSAGTRAPLRGLIDRLAAFFSTLQEACNTLEDSISGDRFYYVYVHKDKNGSVFYVGKGKGRRAWSTDRHVYWYQYVDTRLNGEYTVELVKENLLEHEAETFEDQTIAKYGLDNLINVIPGSSPESFGISISANVDAGALEMSAGSPDRSEEYWKAWDKYRELDDELRITVAETKALEKEQPEVALETYKRCIARFSELAATRPKEPGIKGELEGPWAPGGVDLLPLDRATLLLKQAGRYAELVQIVDAVFSEFPNANRGGGVDDAIIRRRNAAIKKCSITAPPLG